MTDIALNSFIPASLEPRECKLHCAVWNGEHHPIDVLASDWEEWTGWNQWRSNRDEFNRQFIFSMARDRTDQSLWLFGGVFEVLGRAPIPQARSYDVRYRDDIMGAFVKRLQIRFERPGRAIRLNMETHVNQMSVHSVLETPYVGEAFPGHDRINHTMAEIQVVVRQDRADWRVALQHMKGVYVIHDKSTGRAYVGSAYGDVGIWDRLRKYALSLHGGNDGLIALVNERGNDYARENLSFALLEFWSMRTEDQHVLDREAYWKRVLLSREFGMNLN